MVTRLPSHGQIVRNGYVKSQARLASSARRIQVRDSHTSYSEKSCSILTVPQFFIVIHRHKAEGDSERGEEWLRSADSKPADCPRHYIGATSACAIGGICAAVRARCVNVTDFPSVAP